MSLDPVAPVIPKVVQGSDYVLNVQLSDPASEWLDVTGASPISFAFKKADGTAFAKAGAVVDGKFGKLSCTLTPTDTGNLFPGVMDVEVTLTVSGKVSVKQLPQALEAVAQIYPTV
jgi:hypothetical protein